MHHGDAQLAGRERMGGVNPFAVEMDFSFLRGIDAGEDFAERAFARPVLADKRVATAALDFEADAVQRQHSGKAFADVFESQKGHPRSIEY